MNKPEFHPIPSPAGDNYANIGSYFTLKSDRSNAPFGEHDRVILLTFDDHYVDQSINLILSILKYHPSGVSFVCLCPVLSPENQNTLLSVNCPIRLICYEHAPFIHTRKWPACSLFRLFSPWLLDSRIDRVLYLDADILCCGNIQALLDLKPAWLAMCSELSGNLSPDQQPIITKYLPAEIYCNSGVCVMNLDAFRREYSFGSFVELLLQHHEALQYPDQDFLNFFFRDKTTILNGLVYNFQPHEFWDSPHYPYILRISKLIHFSYAKPWSCKSELFLIRLYLKHSLYPPMIRKVKAVRWKNALHHHTITYLPRYFRLWRSGR